MTIPARWNLHSLEFAGECHVHLHLNSCLYVPLAPLTIPARIGVWRPLESSHMPPSPKYRVGVHCNSSLCPWQFLPRCDVTAPCNSRPPACHVDARRNSCPTAPSCSSQFLLAPAVVRAHTPIDALQFMSRWPVGPRCNSHPYAMLAPLQFVPRCSLGAHWNLCPQNRVQGTAMLQR